MMTMMMMSRIGIGTGVSGSGRLLRLLLGLLLWHSQLVLLEACPFTCICKWRGGKQSVECRNQNLNTLPDGIDPETQVLDLSSNKLRILPREAFQRAGLLNLQRIHVRESLLSQIDQGAFSQLINLVEIDLSDNLLTGVPTAALKHTPFLRELYLAGNPIVQIKSGAFEFVPQLVKLDLSRCQLVTIHDFAFTHLQLLESLKIYSNQLSVLSSATVKSLAQLHGVELHGNPWDCDCKLRDLKLWIEKQNIPHPISPECHSPTRLARRRFSDLSVADFACAPRILDSTRHVRGHEGENATLECIFESIPITNIRWYSYGRPIVNNTLISAHRKFLIHEDSTRSVLSLTNALEKDSGDFYCVVENPAGFIEANFTLEILPTAPFPSLETTHILLISLGLLGIFLVILATAIFALCRRSRLIRGRRKGGGGNGTGGIGGVGGIRNPGGAPENGTINNKTPQNGKSMASSTPVKPPRLNYEINPGSLVANGYKGKIDSTDNPDLILETNNSAAYQEPGLEENNSIELNWENQSYRNLAYNCEYPPDYGLPIIHENSVYSDSSYSNVPPPANGSIVMSSLFNKNKMGAGARITAGARDSPDEGYQEGYCGTDV